MSGAGVGVGWEWAWAWGMGTDWSVLSQEPSTLPSSAAFASSTTSLT